jgi:hypothetical protein
MTQNKNDDRGEACDRDQSLGTSPVGVGWCPTTLLMHAESASELEIGKSAAADRPICTLRRLKAALAD